MRSLAILVTLVFASVAWAGEMEKTESCRVPVELKNLWPDPDKVVFAQTTLAERSAFETLIPMLADAASSSDEPPASAQVLARESGFELEVFRANGQTFWALRERKDALRGAGAYVFRTGPAADVALQIPHAYFDLGTDTLGAALFACAPEGYRPRVLLTNTAHRFRGRPGERPQDTEHPADVAHNPDHLFQIVTDLLARRIDAVSIIQLHGFGAHSKKRAEISAVVSGGTRLPGTFPRRIAARLSDVLGEGVRLFPEETEILGGTQNAQGRLTQAYPRVKFVHLELSAKVRRALAKHDDAQRQLDTVAKALFAPEEE